MCLMPSLMLLIKSMHVHIPPGLRDHHPSIKLLLEIVLIKKIERVALQSELQILGEYLDCEKFIIEEVRSNLRELKELRTHQDRIKQAHLGRNSRLIKIQFLIIQVLLI